ncbi:MAG: DUF1616 domain-containing protein [Sulfolobales archaeon]|nr:DUF1616 domain-containing protein [Sulfolobales archaeon]MCX8198510.1 DUF1616 domain-containing protein [Sulfolobales archaeon]MDW8169585.1 DUF1616 domain-containing protein [Desulfurococcaceae archaeon]
MKRELVLEDFVVEKELKSWRKLNYLWELYNKWIDGELVIEDPDPPKAFPDYITRLDYNLWFYTTIMLTLITISIVYFIGYVPFLMPIRYVMGTVFVLFLPGYSLIQALYKPGELSPLEELALSIGLSLAVTPLIGLALNYTPWGIRLTPIVIALSIFTISMTILASYRRFKLLSH